MKRLLAVALLLLPCVASAATVTLTYNLPTAYDDGQSTTLDPSHIIARRVEWTGACPSFSFVAPQNSIVYPGNASTIVVENVTAGTRCFRVFIRTSSPECVVTPTEPCFRESVASNIWTQRVVDAPLPPDPDPDPPPVVLRTPNPATGLTGRQ